MDIQAKLIGARIGMLALADELQSMSRACRVAGISRGHCYEIRAVFERSGRDGLAPVVRPPPALRCSASGTGESCRLAQLCLSATARS